MSLVLHALAVIVDSFPSPCFAIAEDFEPSVGERRSALNSGKMKNKKLFSWLAHDEQPTARKQHNNSPSWTSITVPRSLATNAAASIVVADIFVGSESNVSSVPRMKSVTNSA